LPIGEINKMNKNTTAAIKNQKTITGTGCGIADNPKNKPPNPTALRNATLTALNSLSLSEIIPNEQSPRRIITPKDRSSIIARLSIKNSFPYWLKNKN
jgi:hypothetical protein